MDILKSCVLSVCFCAVAVGVIEALVPGEKHKGRIRLITGALLIISLLSPLKLASDISLPSASEIAEYSPSSELCRAAADSAKEQTALLLRQYEIYSAKITVYTNIDSDNGIVINRVVAAVGKSDIEKASAAAEYGSGALGFKIEIEETV